MLDLMWNEIVYALRENIRFIRTNQFSLYRFNHFGATFKIWQRNIRETSVRLIFLFRVVTMNQVVVHDRPSSHTYIRRYKHTLTQKAKYTSKIR